MTEKSPSVADLFPEFLWFSHDGANVFKGAPQCSHKNFVMSLIFLFDRGKTCGTYIRDLSETTWLAKKGNCSKNGGKSTVMFGCMIRYNFNWY